jgi:hypothetical protein
LTQELDNFIEDLKEVWEPGYRELINFSDPVRSLIDDNSDDIIEGKYFKAAAEIGINAGIGFVGELESLPTPGHVTALNRLENLKKMTGRIGLSREVIKNSRTNEAAVASAMDRNRINTKKSLTREVNFLLNHQGDGVIAFCGTTTASNTVVLSASTPTSVMNYLKSVVAAGGVDTGIRIDIGTTTAPHAVAQTRNVLSVNVAAKTLVIDGATVSTTNNVTQIFRAGQGTDSLQRRVVNSLQVIVDDTAVLHGVDPATFPMWASEVIDADGAPPTEDLFIEAFDQFDIESGSAFSEDNAKIATTHKVRRLLAASMKDRVRYMPLDLRGGFNADTLTVQCAGGPVHVMVDRDLVDDTAYILTPSSLRRKVDEDWHFETEGGGPVYYDITNDSFQMVLIARFEYECVDRRLNARIDNIGTGS